MNDDGNIAALNDYLHQQEILDKAAEFEAEEREIEIKKFVFAETVEANMVALHKEIENGRIQMQKRNVSAEAVKVLTRGLKI